MQDKKFKMQGLRKTKTSPPPKPSVQFKVDNGAVVATANEPGHSAHDVAEHRAHLKDEVEKPLSELEQILAEKIKTKASTEEVCEEPNPPSKE